MMILGLTAQWAPFCAWRKSGSLTCEASGGAGTVPKKRGAEGTKNEKINAHKDSSRKGSQANPASLRRVELGVGVEDMFAAACQMLPWEVCVGMSGSQGSSMLVRLGLA